MTDDTPKPSDEEVIEPIADDQDDAVEQEQEAAEDQPLDPMEALQNDRDELFERLQRVSADYQNYIRRSNESLATSIELAKGDLAKQFICVLDHFDNALANDPEGDEAKALYDGVKIVNDELLRVLKGAGVEPIVVEVGDPFDPEKHEAMLRQAVDGIDTDHISMVMQIGYQQGSRTLRPAKVAVAP